MAVINRLEELENGFASLQNGTLFFGRFSKYQFYFAYGSNMDIQRITERLGPVSFLPMSFSLRDHKFSYNAGLKELGKCFAGITYNPGTVVYGAVFILSKEQLKTLDVYEGVNNGNHGYYRKEVQVVPYDPRNQFMYNFQRLNTITYVPRPQYTYEGGTPQKRYRKHCVDGAKMFGLNSRYITNVLEK